MIQYFPCLKCISKSSRKVTKLLSESERRVNIVLSLENLLINQQYIHVLTRLILTKDQLALSRLQRMHRVLDISDTDVPTRKSPFGNEPITGQERRRSGSIPGQMA